MVAQHRFKNGHSSTFFGFVFVFIDFCFLSFDYLKKMEPNSKMRTNSWNTQCNFKFLGIKNFLKHILYVRYCSFCAIAITKGASHGEHLREAAFHRV